MLTFAIPTWNRADKLGLCVASICEQVKRKDGFRVVVVDHKSTDNTAQVLEQFSKKYEFLSYKTLDYHREGASWIESVGMVETEWTWTFGDDDLLMPDALDKVERVLNQNPNLFFVHATQIKRSQQTEKLYQAPNFLELCSTYGWIDVCGFISSNICRTAEIKESYKNYYHYNDNCLSVFPAAGCLLQTIWDRPAAIFDDHLVALQDDQMTAETKERWAADNHPTRYFYVGDMLKDLIDRVPELPKTYPQEFFRYHTYHLWDRYITHLIESFHSTGQPVDSRFWDKLIDLSKMVADGDIKKQILMSVVSVNDTMDSINLTRTRLNLHRKLCEGSVYGFENVAIENKFSNIKEEII